MAPPNTLKLPRQIIDQLGGEDVLSTRQKSGGRRSTRKDLRKAARAEKKSLRTGPPPTKRTKLQYDLEREAQCHNLAPSTESRPEREESQNTARPKSILKTTKKADPPPKPRNLSLFTSPPRPISRQIREQLAEEDDKIAALEKKLGLKGKKKLPQSFKDDGLDDLLEGLDGGEVQETKKRKAEGDEWLENKRKQARLAKGKLSKAMDDQEESEDEASLMDEDEDEDEDMEDDDGASDMSLDGPEFPDDVSEEAVDRENYVLDEGNVFDGFRSEDSENCDDEETKPAPRIRENPYIAPSTGDAPQKYIPPSLRKPTSSESESLIRLRRQTQGLVNRLTEANLISILADIEKLYQDHPRQHVTSTLVDLLLTSVCEPMSLPDTLIILPAGFIAAVYKIIGMDFGAQIVQRTVELFDEHYTRATVSGQNGPAAATNDGSKEPSNLIMLLSELYNFQVIGCNLVFDYIKFLLIKLSELNAELLLKVIRASGPQLRQDDPSSLKDIVAMLGPAIANVGGEEKLSVRTKFMIETINNLKNNRMKAGGAASAVTSEHTIRMKKTLGTLNTRSIKASEPLRIGLKDIKDSDKKGKWWLVGASWSGNIRDENKDPTMGGDSMNIVPRVEDAGTSDLVQLAKEQRMNTDVRRAIFVTIVSATDFQDAYLKLMKLKLKKVQEYEIPKVLIHCSGAEKAYNPYYTLIAKKICGDRRLKTAFQYCLWDLFKKMGESEDDDDEMDENDEAMDTRHIVNLAKMFGTLIVEGGLGLVVLKNLNLSYLQPKTKTFIEVLFITILLQSQKQSNDKRDVQGVIGILSKVKDTPQLIRGLQYFLKKVVSKTDIAGGKSEKATVKWACKVAGDTLESLTVIDTKKA